MEGRTSTQKAQVHAGHKDTLETPGMHLSKDSRVPGVPLYTIPVSLKMSSLIP